MKTKLEQITTASELITERNAPMKRYEVEITDYVTHATYPIDTVTAKDGYTAEQYIADCTENADPDYIELLHTGLVTLTEIE